ncbi:MAG: HAMP domain-containing histidine kinase [Flavobacteriales bacterium]|nr:HAMP domain-containing histidine kinase [Flavobacteriales bacterium]
MNGVNRRTLWLFLGLTVYILAQFTWWAVLLLRLNARVDELSAALPDAEAGRPATATSSTRTTMVLGEAGVFLLLLLIVVWLTYRAVRRDLRLAETQRNFLLAVTHELRTPIAAIKLQLQTLERPDLSSEHRRALQETAGEEADRLTLLTDKVLQAAMGDESLTLVREPLDVMGLARGVIERAQASFAKHHILQLEGPAQLETRTDGHVIRSILENLVENATKYAPQSSVIEVRMETGDPGWRLTVSDQGPGIAHEEKKRIFERFYRVGREETREQRGTGLGLYIVKRLVMRCGGTVEVRDRVPHGAIFTVEFPHH